MVAVAWVSGGITIAWDVALGLLVATLQMTVVAWVSGSWGLSLAALGIGLSQQHARAAPLAVLVAVAGLKSLVTLGFCWLLLRWNRPDTLAFGLGVGAFPLTWVLVALRQARGTHGRNPNSHATSS